VKLHISLYFNDPPQFSALQQSLSQSFLFFKNRLLSVLCISKSFSLCSLFLFFLVRFSNFSHFTPTSLQAPTKKSQYLNKEEKHKSKSRERINRNWTLFMDIDIINSFLEKGSSNIRDTDVLTSKNYLNQRGFKVVRMLGCGSFGAVMLAE